MGLTIISKILLNLKLKVKLSSCKYDRKKSIDCLIILWQILLVKFKNLQNWIVLVNTCNTQITLFRLIRLDKICLIILIAVHLENTTDLIYFNGTLYTKTIEAGRPMAIYEYYVVLIIPSSYITCSYSSTVLVHEETRTFRIRSQTEATIVLRFILTQFLVSHYRLILRKVINS